MESYPSNAVEAFEITYANRNEKQKKVDYGDHIEYEAQESLLSQTVQA